MAPSLPAIHDASPEFGVDLDGVTVGFVVATIGFMTSGFFASRSGSRSCGWTTVGVATLAPGKAAGIATGEVEGVVTATLPSGD